MFNKERLKEIIVKYKKDFVNITWAKEKYKWENIKHFQEHWDINAKDFANMLKKALSETDNLLDAVNKYPRDRITKYANDNPEEIRKLFINLFDESKDVYSRIENFKKSVTAIASKYTGNMKNHYQDENTISVYLWLRYPDKYYIYKFKEVKAVVEKLESDCVIKKGKYEANLKNFTALYDEICEVLNKDEEIKVMLNSKLTENCYPDTKLKTLTGDLSYYITSYLDRYLPEEQWWPTDYNPGFNVTEWVKLLNDKTVFHESSLQIMKRILDNGGSATCAQLSSKYGETVNFYNAGSSFLAKRIAKKTGCIVIADSYGDSKWWPILYIGKNANASEKGSFVWKLRDELKEALGKVDLSDINLYAKNTPRIWKISHGNDIITEEEFNTFSNRNVVVVNGDTKAKGKFKFSQGYEFKNNMRKGDFFYLCRGNSIRLLGRIDSENVTVSVEKNEPWYERSYTVIADSLDKKAYNGKQKWWTPNCNSTCICVPEIEEGEFEEWILKPYFGISKEELLNNKEGKKNCWLLVASPKIWSMENIPVGEEQSYTLYGDKGSKRRIFKNFLDAKLGDVIIGYEANPSKKIVAILRVSREQDGKSIYFEKVEELETPIELRELLEVPELKNAEFIKNRFQGSFFKVTDDEYNIIMDMIRQYNPVSNSNELPTYTEKDFLTEVYMNEEKYKRIVSVLRKKKNIILQGAPGVGKTFAAKRLAYSIMGVKDDERIKFVQFHQNYSYEQFIEGYKPCDAGFTLEPGIFRSFCKLAKQYPEKEYFFVIDEINRGNLSKIFGELLMLIEEDYRDTYATLAYSKELFSVPKNVYIIGMMNTADRSLAMIDYALRRRFSFIEMDPSFESERFKKYQESIANETFNKLIEKVKELNLEIIEDKSLGKGFCIGHSYFCNVKECTVEWMKDVVDFDILPMLSEYWFDDIEKVERWENILHGVFQ